VCVVFDLSFSAATHPTAFRPVSALPIVSQTTNQVRLLDDMREAHSWLRYNTPEEAKIVSWRGVGHQISSFARGSVLGRDLEHPQNLDKVAKLLVGDETNAAQVMRELGAEYVIVIFGGKSGFHPDDINRLNELSPDGQINPLDSVLFKLSYKGFAEQYTRPQQQTGFDLLRRQQVSFKPQVTHFDEVFTSENWVVRIFRLREHPIESVGGEGMEEFAKQFAGVQAELAQE